MILPNKKLHLPDTKTVDRLFLHFIDKNNIIIESPSDVVKASEFFSDCVCKYFKDKWGMNHDNTLRNRNGIDT